MNEYDRGWNDCIDMVQETLENLKKFPPAPILGRSEDYDLMSLSDFSEGTGGTELAKVGGRKQTLQTRLQDTFAPQGFLNLQGILKKSTQRTRRRRRTRRHRRK